MSSTSLEQERGLAVFQTTGYRFHSSDAQAPGFDYGDFELGSRDALTTRFPEAAEVIVRLATAVTAAWG
jgi:predicted cupin superfamily sugar epimerase